MKKNNTTDFQGPISLDAILAATSKKEEKVEIPKKEVKEETIDTQSVEDKLTQKEEKSEPVKQENIIEETQPENNQIDKENKKSVSVVDNVEEETSAFKTAQKLIEFGMLEDFQIQISENEEGVSISDFKSMTEENLQEIIKIHQQDRKEEISSNYISKEGLKEHQLKVIEILKNGGDLSKIAESPEKAFERPFEGFDMEDQQRQIDVRYTDLVHSKGLDHESAITIINNEVKSGKLAEKATETFNVYRAAHEKYIDDKLKEQRKQKEFEDLNFKENKKSLVAKLKEAGIKESVYKKVSSEYSKKNEKGEYALLDKVKNMLDNPEENYEIILHLSDPTLFNNIFKIKAAKETQKTIVRLASGVANKGNKKTIKSNNSTNIEAPWIKAGEAYNNLIK